ncbi:hypothetical protein [Curtobacterium sp. MCPF17_021]|uniref:hypothetical protein n=1 Tax=Curtobacterium sp. MCPF17_021 TaxID=2175639 RepID=UPI0011B7AEB6|nr:hypothetical protein [Curtobacterium sp. MCPF17_021]WIE83220.1 hypothetical protein DEJ29_017815 [Curtobacterium sp. MCPF17_021]
MSAMAGHVHDDAVLDVLRSEPVEWRRRGLTPPAELDAIIARRLAGAVRGVPADPTYADFFAGG